MRIRGIIFLVFWAGFATSVHAHSRININEALNATLVVYSDGGQREFLGSAFVLATDAGPMIVTNSHVVAGHPVVALKRFDGRWLSGRVTRQDVKRDLAVVTVDDPQNGLQASVGKVNLAAPVFALGAPLAHEFTVTSGIVSGWDILLDPVIPVGLIRHDAAINPGSSGGPLVNANGEVIGMNSQIADGSRLFAGIGYAIPVSVIDDWLHGLLQSVPDLGFSGRNVTQTIATALGLSRTNGVLVETVEPSGWAMSAGVQTGDVILYVNEHRVADDAGMAAILDKRSNPTVNLRIWRAGNDLHLAAPLPQESLSPLQIGEPTKAQNFKTLADADVDFAENSAAVVKSGPMGNRIGLFKGDTILAWNGYPLTSKLKGDIAHKKIEGPIVLLVKRDERTLHIVIDPTALPAAQKIFGGNILDPAVVSF